MHDTPQAVLRRNRIRSIRERLAGGRDAYYTLPVLARQRLNESARDLYHAGETPAHAIESERRRSDGFVYVVTNRAWPGYCKIGRAFNPITRVANFNIGDPHRRYRLAGATYFTRCGQQEAKLHAALRPWRCDNSEWFRVPTKSALQLLTVAAAGAGEAV